MLIFHYRANGLPRGLFISLMALGCMTATAAAERRQFDIPAGAVVHSLHSFSQQSQLQILFDADAVDDITAHAVRGDLEVSEALSTMLGDTALAYRFVNDRTVAISRQNSERRVRVAALLAAEEPVSGPSASTDQRDAVRAEDKDKQVMAAAPESVLDRRSMPEVLIRGSSINADIRRTEDDIQPYVIFDQEQIERSGAPDLETFFKSQLPMNAAMFTQEQNSNFSGSAGGLINLRGLGTNQTLILVDGRRVPGVTNANIADFLQPDISGIPLSAIERIEVLPATAGAIYGGGATGGVINVIRKRQYQGVELGVDYAGDFAGDFSSTRVHANGGMSLRGGATTLSFTAAYSDSNPLLVVDRDFGSRARELALSNGSSPFTGIRAPLGTLPNVCSGVSNGFGSGSCTGVPLVLDNGTQLGSAYTSVPEGYEGPSSDGGAALAANAGVYNLGIPSDGQYLLRSPVMTSGSISVRHSFSPNFDAFIDATWDRSTSDLSEGTVQGSSTFLAAADPANPFQQDIVISRIQPDFHRDADTETEVLGGTAGLIVRLPRQWAASLEQSIGRSSFFNNNQTSPVSPEGIAALRSGSLQDLNAHPVDISAYRIVPPAFSNGPFDTRQDATTLRVSGPTIALPAGPIRLTALIEQRKQVAEEAFSDQTNDVTNYSVWYPERSQKVRSYYLETVLPVIAPAQGLRFMRELEFQAAARRDEYKSVSTFTNLSFTAPTRAGPFPTPVYSTNETESARYLLGLRVAPVPSMALRASFATGFLPPALSQITPRITEVTNPNPANNPADPKRGNTPMNFPRTQITAGNPNLSPEDSETISAGIILTPSFARSMRLSLDYSRIRKTDELYAPTLNFILANEDFLPGRIVRGANLSTDPPGWAGPVTQLDFSTINLSKAVIEAVDLKMDFAWGIGRAGKLYFSALGTVTDQLERQVTAETVPYDSVGYYDGPLEWRGNASLAWERGPFQAQWSTQYFDDYFITFSNPGFVFANAFRLNNHGSARIPSQIYHDVSFRFRPRTTGMRLLDNVDIALGVQNVFNASPPIVAINGVEEYAGETYSGYGDPRRRRFTLAFRKSFGD
jgi:iron complex outermembrane recepter protein